MRWIVIGLSWLALWLPSPVDAQESVCTIERAGIVVCIAGKLCSCSYDRGGTVTGMPAGYRWDCGIKRPSCGGAEAPATLNEYPYLLPPGLTIEEPRQRHRDRWP
jgi:hypothetical protein